ncbi:MAG: DapH/DapD/GlmU-related protein [Chloroflexota bacterium]
MTQFLPNKLEQQARDRLAECERHAEAGVTIVDALSTYIDASVKIGAGTTIEPNTTIRGRTTIGRNARIGPNSVLENATIGDRCVVFSSVVRDSTMDEGSDIGPFAQLRGNTHVEEDVHLGHGVEVNRSRIGRGSKLAHFGYIGDATIGTDVNIGAGTVTCNYDGTNKNKTVIGDGAFIGSDSMLVAPLRIGKGAQTAAGSVVTKDVADGERVGGVPAKPLNQKDSRG